MIHLEASLHSLFSFHHVLYDLQGCSDALDVTTKMTVAVYLTRDGASNLDAHSVGTKSTTIIPRCAFGVHGFHVSSVFGGMPGDEAPLPFSSGWSRILLDAALRD